MRRRTTKYALEVPAELATFTPEAWADDLDTAVDRWSAARLEWLKAHRDEVDGVWYFRTTLFEIHRARGRDWPEPGRRHR